MDELIRFLADEGSRGTTVSLWEAAFAVSVSWLCSLAIGMCYRATHRTPGYSQAFIHTLCLISMITAVIMIVIGSNIARAFSLVGAMSIIRFRNAVKETRDVGFLFFGIACGMAAGTRFYALALLTTGLICAIMIVMERFEFGRPSGQPDALLRIQIAAGTQPETLLHPVFADLFVEFSLISVESAKQGLATEMAYSVRPKPALSANTVIEKLGDANGNMKVLYYVGAHSDPL